MKKKLPAVHVVVLRYAVIVCGLAGLTACATQTIELSCPPIPAFTSPAHSFNATNIQKKAAKKERAKENSKDIKKVQDNLDTLQKNLAPSQTTSPDQQ
jgi:hypothetical protein